MINSAVCLSVAGNKVEVPKTSDFGGGHVQLIIEGITGYNYGILTGTETAELVERLLEAISGVELGPNLKSVNSHRVVKYCCSLGFVVVVKSALNYEGTENVEVKTNAHVAALEGGEHSDKSVPILRSFVITERL